MYLFLRWQEQGKYKFENGYVPLGTQYSNIALSAAKHKEKN